MSSKYNEAINAYERAIKMNEIEPDYAFFQKAISYGYIGQGATKIKELGTFINAFERSPLRDDALYELANSYVKNGEEGKAMRLYDQLYKQYRSSPYISKSLLRQGLVYYNSGENEQALSKFKNVANNYPGSQEGVQAVSTARLIYIDLGRVDEYARWVKSLDYIDVSDAELDNTSYESAEKQYLANDNSRAIRLFNGYLNEFPNGFHALKSHFYLAQLYYKEDLQSNAAPHYDYVVNKPSGEFTELALTRLGEIYLNENDHTKAMPILERLEKEADFPQNVIFAQSNLMKVHYQLQDYNQSVNYAEKVLTSSRADKNVKSDAHIIIARSAMKTGDDTKAKSAYAQVERIASGELAAEALYYNAYFKNQEGQYKSSNTVVQKLAKDYSGYKLYGAKGLVIMAKNFYALDDAYQATYILESVTQNFAEFSDVVTEARAELRKIKSEQAKTNASVETDNGN